MYSSYVVLFSWVYSCGPLITCPQAHTYTHANTHIHSHGLTHAHTWTHSPTHTHTHAHTHTNNRAAKGVRCPTCKTSWEGDEGAGNVEQDAGAAAEEESNQESTDTGAAAMEEDDAQAGPAQVEPEVTSTRSSRRRSGRDRR